MELAHKLGIQFVDLDQDIEKETKRSVSEIFELYGEAHFRQLEKKHLEKVIASIDTFVMATGGGTPCFFNNLSTMKREGTVIFLKTPIKEIERRLAHDTTRPLLKENKLEDLGAERKGWYEQADYTVENTEVLISMF